MSDIRNRFESYLQRFADGKIVDLPADDFNVRDVTVTNLINVNSECLFAVVHFLFGYDDGSEMFTSNLGYRFAYRDDDHVSFDLDYLSGNTYLFKDFKVKKEKKIDNTPLYSFVPENNRDLIYLFAWALDTGDKKLLENCCKEDVRIYRAGVNGDHYEMNGLKDADIFMKKYKEYYFQNQYSLVIEREDENEVLAYHLYPANTGNKHLGSNTRYVQFFNEDVTFTIDQMKIQNVIFKRKERPIVKRSRIISL